MIKPIPRIPKPIYQYNEVIKYIEEKYHISTFNYGKSLLENQFVNANKIELPKTPQLLTGEEQKNANNRLQFKKDYEEYLKEMVRFIDDFYNWLKENDIEHPEEQNFYRWLVVDYGIEFGHPFQLLLMELIKKEQTPEWVKSILQLIAEEFETDEMWLE